MKIQAKLFSGFFFVISLVCLASLFFLFSLRGIRAHAKKVTVESIPAIEALGEIRGAGLRLLAELSESIAFRNDAIRGENKTVATEERAPALHLNKKNEIREARVSLEAAVLNYTQLLSAYYPAEKQSVTRLRDIADNLAELGQLAVSAQFHPEIPGELRAFQRKQEAVETSFLTFLDSLDAQAKNVLHRQNAVTAGVISGSINYLLALSIVIIALAALTSYYLSRRIAEPIRKLDMVAARMDEGNLDTRVEVDSGDEIGSLARTFNSMVDRIRRYQTNLESMVETKTRELYGANIALSKEIITRKQAEEALKASEEELRAIIEHSATGITVSDVEGRIQQANPAFLKMIGYRMDELKGLLFAKITYDEDVGGHQAIYDEMIAGKRESFEMKKRFVHQKGHVVWGKVALSVVRGVQERPSFVVSIIDDISVHRQLEEERFRAGKLETVGVLAGGIAHDFNNILTGILGNLALSRMMLGCDGGHILEKLRAAEDAAMRARGLTQQLLTFSKGGAPVRESASIVDLITDSAKFVLSGSNVKCSYVIPEDIWSIDVDEGQISQVLQNLILNADQAMENGGELMIAATNFVHDNEKALPLAFGNYVRVDLQDTGMGIEAGHLAKIFDPFYTTKSTGTGLGLATSYSIVKNHDGHIEVNSTLGHGACFSVYLPAAKGAVRTLKKAETEFLRGSGYVLVMDDEEMVRHIAGEMLKLSGFEVLVVTEGREAVEQYGMAMQNGKPFDAVILDLTIPGGMGGLETLGRLRDLDPGVKAIVSSGYSRDPVMSCYREHGFVGVVPKPWDHSELVGKLCQILSC